VLADVAEEYGIGSIAAGRGEEHRVPHQGSLLADATKR